MHFYDTVSRTIREFEPIERGRVGMYTCGPTVYRFSHLGNLRTWITADLLRRALGAEGNEVIQILNITDVGHMADEVNESGEDRMMIAVEDEGLAPEEIADKYSEAFLRHSRMVGILPASKYPRATDHIPEMIEIIRKLFERGHAYESGGTVYFDVDSFEDYGRLSHNTRDKPQAGHRIAETDPAKKNHYDFTLWRPALGGRLMKWPSQWGDGYPGWHIECSAMSMKYLGERFDLHTGGSDNIFPHHEDEIAQSDGATGHPVVGYWLHGHHLLADGRRMAKSANNFFTADDVVERGFDPLSYRYLVLQARYRSQKNFTWEALEAAQRGLDKLRRQVAEWAGPDAGADSEEAAALSKRFFSAVADDMDTPSALRVVSELAAAPISSGHKFVLIQDWDAVLGLDLDREVVTRSDLPSGTMEKIEAREKARAAGDWDAADRLRDELASMGVEVIDTASGPRWIVRS
jgi:cysteinyl-tRNA synthetase